MEHRKEEISKTEETKQDSSIETIEKNIPYTVIIFAIFYVVVLRQTSSWAFCISSRVEYADKSPMSDQPMAIIPLL